MHCAIHCAMHCAMHYTLHSCMASSSIVCCATSTPALSPSPGVWLLEANSSPDMSRNAPVLRKIVDEATDDLITLVLATQQGVSTVKLAAERRERAAPCWRLTCRSKQETERELHGRRVEVVA